MNLKNVQINDILKVDTQWYINFYQVTRLTKTQIIAKILPNGNECRFLLNGAKIGSASSFYRPFAYKSSQEEYKNHLEAAELQKWLKDFKDQNFKISDVKKLKKLIVDNNFEVQK